jgi:hypothetical protein
MATKKSLTASEFESLQPYLVKKRFGDKSIEAIRRVLVEQAIQKDIAAELNITKEAVSAMVSRAWKLQMEHGSRPAGWVKVEAILPPDFAEIVQSMENIARLRDQR